MRWTRAYATEPLAFSGLTVDVPSLFIAGKSDWGVYQRTGTFEAMRKSACTRMRGVHLLEGAGHWVQQEQPTGSQPAGSSVPRAASASMMAGNTPRDCLLFQPLHPVQHDGERQGRPDGLLLLQEEETVFDQIDRPGSRGESSEQAVRRARLE